MLSYLLLVNLEVIESLFLRALLLVSAIDIASVIRISHIDITKITKISRRGELPENILPSSFARNIINVIVIACISIVNISDVENSNDIVKESISYAILRTRDNSISLLDFISGIERAKTQLNARENAVAIANILAEDIFKPGNGRFDSHPDVSIEKRGDVKKFNNMNSLLRLAIEWDTIQIDTDITRIIAIISSSNNVSKYNAFSQKLEYLKSKIPSDEDTAAQWLDFAIQLIDTFLTSFDLDKDLVNFSLEEAQSLEKYLYSVKLIIDCKNAAVRVSHKEWKTIESRLLTVPHVN